MKKGQELVWKNFGVDVVRRRRQPWQRYRLEWR